MVVSHENALMLFSNLSLVAMSYYMMMAAAVEERTGYRHDLVGCFSFDISLKQRLQQAQYSFNGTQSKLFEAHGSMKT
jgi:hypothetical protein